MKRRHLLPAAALLHPAAWAAPAAPRLGARIDALVAEEMAAQQIPGLALGVLQRGQTLHRRGYGSANLEHGVPVTPATRFQTGSVAKQFTGVAVMLLVEDGRLDLDASITRWLPDAPASWAPITPRHLLTNTSGIPDYDERSLDYRKDYSEDELARLAYALPLQFPPGSRFVYSNTGYVLLGILVRKASGQFYGELLQQRVFTPLGLRGARVISEADLVPQRAAGYRLVDGQLKNQEWVSPSLNTTADGSLYLTLDDWLRWAQVLRRRALLRPASWAQVFAPVRLTSGKPFPYGFGWDLHAGPGPAWYGHTGAWQGFRIAYLHGIDAGLTVVVLTNLASADPQRVARRVAQLLQPALLRPPTEALPAEPALLDAVRALLAATADGRLDPGAFEFQPLEFFPGTAERYRALLALHGPLSGLTLLDRREQGDDLALTLRARYASASLLLRLARTPAGRWSSFDLTPDTP